ncbi:class I SAM-dependent methyltransferase [Kitasatospora indigofera]|uniref:class I SAM-dependent methyltransferase n=1 Tax=Kitasatospora indigofera TaxID=67307 RepID=UPI0036C06279
MTRTPDAAAIATAAATAGAATGAALPHPVPHLSSSPQRLSGAAEVARYNWPLYAAGSLTAAVGLALSRRLTGTPAAVARLGALAATGLLTSSTLATWCVYDRSELRSLDWLSDLLPDGPGDHLIVSTGLDEASLPFAARWPGGRQLTADLYDPDRMTEGSIRRARRTAAPAPGTLPGRPDALPVDGADLDTVVCLFSAHELRRPVDRAALFGECMRVLRPGGTLLLVEHLRDTANAAVYGPGAWHFQTRRTWLDHAVGAGLRPAGERRIAGLVTAFAFRRSAG